MMSPNLLVAGKSHRLSQPPYSESATARQAKSYPPLTKAEESRSLAAWGHRGKGLEMLDIDPWYRTGSCHWAVDPGYLVGSDDPRYCSRHADLDLLFRQGRMSNFEGEARPLIYVPSDQL